MAQLNNLIVDSNAFNGGIQVYGEIHTSFDPKEVVNGSVWNTEMQGITIPRLIEILKFSSGGSGSAYINSSYTLGSTTLSVGWYNFIWIPHRTGGYNGEANENTTAGSLILSGMTIEGFSVIRYYNSTIQSLHKWY